MLSEIGRKLRLTIFGTSHGPAVGCVLEGLPAGFTVDMESLQTFLNRCRPEPPLHSGVMNRIYRTLQPVLTNREYVMANLWRL